MKKWQWGLIFVGVSIDQITKIVAEKYLHFMQPVTLIDGALSFQLVHNYGAAYGILQGHRFFLLAISALVFLVCIKYAKSLATSQYSEWGLGFLLIGTVGNFLDRLYLGFVIDFVDIGLFPVFNIADVCIDIGIVLFLLELWMVKDVKNKG
jgi:signal peptidase II